MLLHTKLNPPPIKPEIINRQRLIDKMEANLDRLLLISAPAGFGKTTLICNWLASQAYKFGWLSIDENDNDPVIFFIYLIATLQKIDPRIGKSLEASLDTFSSVDYKQVINVLINDIVSLDFRFILILDDYHEITNKQIHQAIDLFLEYAPQQITFAVSTRIDPPFPLSRFRVRRQVTEIRSADLRFTQEEAIKFLNDSMKLNLSDEDVALLENRTEGWIASLQLAALSLQKHSDKGDFVRSFSGSHHYIIDYLVDEVISHQPEHIQKFLHYTAIMDKICPGMCSYVLKGELDRQDYPEMIHQIEHNNLFLIPLDESFNCFRYHHLFGEVLRQKMRLNFPDVMERIYGRVSLWYEQREELYPYRLGEAIKYALLAKNYDRAASLIEKKAILLANRSSWKRIIQWVKELPDDLLSSHPVLCTTYIWSLIHTSPNSNIESYLSVLENNPQLHRQVYVIKGVSAYWKHNWDEAILQLTEVLEEYQKKPIDKKFKPIEEFARAKAQEYLGKAYFYKGDMDSAIAIFEKALKFAKKSENLALLFISSWGAIGAKSRQGELKEAYSLGMDCLDFITKMKYTEKQFIKLSDFNTLTNYQVNPSMASLIFFTLAWINYEWNHLDKTKFFIKQILHITQFVHQGGAIYHDFLVLIHYFVYQENWDEVTSWVEKLDEYRNTAQSELEKGYADEIAMDIRLFIYQKYPQKNQFLNDVRQWVSTQQFTLDDLIDTLNEGKYRVWAKFLILQNKAEKGLSVLQQLIDNAYTGDRNDDLIRYYILQASAYHNLSHHNYALISLEKAIVLAKPQGYIRSFVDGAPIILNLLQELQDKKPSSYINQLISAFPSSNHTIKNSQTQKMVETLNPREKTILRCMGQGYSNKEIGENLYISVNTVKWHCQNIYKKLGVKNRTKAVSRARQMGIL